MVKLVHDLMYWEQLTWVDPHGGPGCHWVYAWDRDEVYIISGEGRRELYVYDMRTDSITFLTNLPWGVHGGAGIAYCATRRKLYVIRGWNTPHFCEVDLETLTVTTLANAPFNVGYDWDDGGQPSIVHPCTAMNPNVPSVDYTIGTTSYTAGPDDQVYVIRGMETGEFAMYDIANNQWVRRANTPWNNRSSGIYWCPEWNPGKIVLLCRRNTRYWAVYDIATDTWTAYEWTVYSHQPIPWWLGKATYNRGFGGKHLLIIVRPNLALDLDKNVVYPNPVPRYFGRYETCRPGHACWFAIIDGVPYLYTYDCRNKGSFVRTRMINLELGWP